jgi:hypothetical protein
MAANTKDWITLLFTSLAQQQALMDHHAEE